MKAIVCEMCGGQELLKKDGVYVCQHCGTQYTVEEARKLIVEGKVDVSGSSVIVDNLPQVEALLARAKGFERENGSKAIEYYNKVLDIDPQNVEALDSIERIKKIRSEKEGGCYLGCLGAVLLFMFIAKILG